MPAQRIAIGNGSCDILLAAGDALLEPGAELVYAWPSFSVYPHLAAASGARAIEVPLDDSHYHQLDKMAEEINAATRLVIVCNPNNPTSTALPIEAIAEFIAGVPHHVAVILDEAYIEFNVLQDPDESVALLDKHPNLALLRTFSKVYGLCGLRVGYALCGSRGVPHGGRSGAPAVLLQRRGAGGGDRVPEPPGRGDAARRAQPRRADGPGGRAARAGPFSRRVAGELRLGRRAAEDEGDVMRGLSERGVLVRAGGALGRPGALRVTVGTQAENERFLEALAALL